MFHGYDDDYDRHDILKHLNMLDLHAEKLLKVVVDAGALGLDKHGNKWTPDTFFAEYIPDNFIRSREVLLGSLRDGLSFGGKSEPACNIEKGCGIPTMLSMIPLEAIQRMYFAKPEIQLEDLLGVLLPKYGEGSEHQECCSIFSCSDCRFILKHHIIYFITFLPYRTKSCTWNER